MMTNLAKSNIRMIDFFMNTHNVHSWHFYSFIYNWPAIGFTCFWSELWNMQNSLYRVLLTSHYLKQWRLRYMSQYGVNSSQWMVNIKRSICLIFVHGSKLFRACRFLLFLTKVFFPIFKFATITFWTSWNTLLCVTYERLTQQCF